MRLIPDSLFIIASFLAVLLWKESALSNLTGPVIGTFTLLYCITTLVRSKKHTAFGQKQGWEKLSIFLLQSVIFILIISTGGINSALFPLLYFLSFAVAFEYEPPMVFVFTAILLLLFLPEALRSDPTQNLIKIGLVLLLSPLAYFLSSEFRLRLKQEKQKQVLEEHTKIATKQITDDIVGLVEDQAQKLNQTDLERLNDVLHQIHELQEQTNQNEKP
jgi:hypothetical protein